MYLTYSLSYHIKKVQYAALFSVFLHFSYENYIMKIYINLEKCMKSASVALLQYQYFQCFQKICDFTMHFYNSIPASVSAQKCNFLTYIYRKTKSSFFYIYRKKYALFKTRSDFLHFLHF